MKAPADEGQGRLSLAVRLVAVFAIASPLIAPLGRPGLLNPDEGRAAEIAREMVATGDWTVPRLHGVPHWAKPPLAYWAIAASVSAFGTTDRAARLPSAIAATLALLATWTLARRMGGARVALLSVAALATMVEFHLLGRMAMPDMIQTACIAWAAALLWIGRQPKGTPAPNRIRASRIAACACLGISFLDKGPVALGVTAAAILVFALLRPRTSLLSWREIALGLPVLLALGLPWFLTVVRLHPGLREFFLEGEVRDRILTGRGRGKAFWFFPVIFLLGTLPWTPVLFASLGRMAKQALRPKTAEDEPVDAGRFLLAWIVGPFLLFSCAQSKLAHYLLPLMPFCAIAAARGVTSLAERARARGWSIALAAAPAVLASGAAAGFLLLKDRSAIDWVVAAALVAAVSAAPIVALVRRRAASPDGVAFAVAIVTLAWLWTVPRLAHEDRADFRGHASHEWLREALAGENVRGVPIGPGVRPAPGAHDFGDATFAKYRVRSHTVDFYLLGLRPERFPNFGGVEEWEMPSDKSAAVPWTLPDLAALLQHPRRMHVLARADALDDLEAAVGRPLRRIQARGKGVHAVVLVSND